jgi:hypothetical protein
MREPAHPERAPAMETPVHQRALPGADPAARKVLSQRLHRAKLKVASEYDAHGLGLRRLNDAGGHPELE